MTTLADAQLREPAPLQEVIASRARTRLGAWLPRRLGPAWPLKLLLVWFPLWWALGLTSVVFVATSAVMAVQMVRRGRLRLPVGFSVWLLFLGWMLAGVAMLWVDAPGTVPGGGPQRLVGFSVRVLWYLAVTVAMLYPLSFTSKALPAIQVARWLSCLFLTAVVGGLLGLVAPSFNFPSPLELLIPGVGDSGFVYTQLHPALTTSSDFLGYEQPRPRAPFAFANAWGNNVGLLLPFFVLACLYARRRWQRWSLPVVLAAALLPIVYSLNRGLWLGLSLVAVYSLGLLLRARRFRAVSGLVAAAMVALALIITSPVGETIVTRLETPHSNARRTTVAEVVTTTTWEGSPLLGYGTTRDVLGSFGSIGGGQTPQCRQCAAPPLGTQGFLWRLIFTTGFVGTALFAIFMAWQWIAHARRRTPMAVVGCLSLAASALYFVVYDSLESPLFILMLAVGLMNRERFEEKAAELRPERPGQLSTTAAVRQ